MVFQQEQASSWLSPTRRSVSAKFFEEDPGASKDKLAWYQVSPKSPQTPHRKLKEEFDKEKIIERDPSQMLKFNNNDYDALECADRLEMGMSREILSEFMVPVKSKAKLQRYNVLRSEDAKEFRLLSGDYAFMLFARVCAEERRIDIFQYDPKDDNLPAFDPSRPAFTLTYNISRTDWRLVQERCEHCQYSPKHLSCSCRGKQQVACVRHFATKLGDGVSSCMEVKIPGLGGDGSPVIWCPRLGRRDLASPGTSPSSRSHGNGGESPGCPGGSPVRAVRSGSPCVSPCASERGETDMLSTKLPTWNEEFKCLVLDFEGRTVMASPHNFQLSSPEDPDELVCQYGKIGPNTFSLDFKQPLSIIQAFGVSLSTSFCS